MNNSITSNMNKMMSIFVASRMKNIVERKTVIDVVHYLGHLPIFIEAEQMRQGEKSKPLIDEMIQRSDAFITITDDHLGIREEWLGQREPLVYEIQEFQNRAKKMGWNLSETMVTFVRKNFRDDPVSAEVYSTICRIVGGENNTISYKEYDDLAVSVWKVIEKRWGKGQPPKGRSIYLQIEYSGQDEPGELGAIAELLYTEFHLNVTHVAGTAVDSRANILVTAVPLAETASNLDAGKVARSLERSLKRNLKGDVYVRAGSGSGFKPRYYFELRVLDVPGVLNALCKALKALDINICDLRQRPAPAEFDRQSIIIMWLLPAKADEDTDTCYLRVEARLRNLVGVLAVSSHIIPKLEE